MSDHASTLRAQASTLRAHAALACESVAASLEREAERQRSECSRSTLAPEHAAALRRKAAHGGTPSYLRDAIRAALAALGEEV